MLKDMDMEFFVKKTCALCKKRYNALRQVGD